MGRVTVTLRMAGKPYTYQSRLRSTSRLAEKEAVGGRERGAARGRAAAGGSVPGEGAPGLVLDDPGLEEVLLLAQVHDFTHPGEGVLDAPELLRKPQLAEAAVGDEVEVFLHHARVHAQHAPGHAVLGIFHFQLGALEEDR